MSSFPSTCLNNIQERAYRFFFEATAITVGVTYNKGTVSARKNKGETKNLSQRESAPGLLFNGISRRAEIIRSQILLNREHTKGGGETT